MKWLVGIDEAGRGPLAGPVAVGVFAMRKGANLPIMKKVKDSKQCSLTLREKLYLDIKCPSEEILHSVGFSSAQYIDKYGIVPAIKNAMKKALLKLEKELKWKPEECQVYLDGALKAPPEYTNQKTIIKGDSLIPVISVASICAKVLRDRRMTYLAKKYPQFSFEIHKGYGTPSHRKMIKKNGICLEHRRSFLRKLTQTRNLA